MKNPVAVCLVLRAYSLLLGKVLSIVGIGHIEKRAA